MQIAEAYFFHENFQNTENNVTYEADEKDKTMKTGIVVNRSKTKYDFPQKFPHVIRIWIGI
jgi:hypothetical protein